MCLNYGFIVLLEVFFHISVNNNLIINAKARHTSSLIIRQVADLPESESKAEQQS